MKFDQMQASVRLRSSFKLKLIFLDQGSPRPWRLANLTADSMDEFRLHKELAHL